MNASTLAVLARREQDREAAADAVDKLRKGAPDFLAALGKVLDLEPPEEIRAVTVDLATFTALQMLAKVGLGDCMVILLARQEPPGG